MYNAIGNQWIIPTLGLLDIPDHLKRHNDAWVINTENGARWMWFDKDHGENYMDSLREAVPFAITIGSLEIDKAKEYIDLHHKGRLTPTGVIGVFYRSGLKQAYHVIIEGEVVIFPYSDGRGFCKAAKAAGRLMSEKTKRFVAKIELENTFTTPF